jgi:HEAT repeat protein
VWLILTSKPATRFASGEPSIEPDGFQKSASVTELPNAAPHKIDQPKLRFEPGSKLSAFYQKMAEFAQNHGSKAIPSLQDFLNDANWQTRCAALRALAYTGSPEAARILAAYINNETSIEESAQAVMALGEMQLPGTTQTLLEKYSEKPNDSLRSCLLDTLASRPYSETASFFQNYLNATDSGMDEKAEVIAALGFYKEAPIELITPFLNSTVENLRAGAYQALAFRGNSLQGQLLLSKINSENSPETRASLYEAIGAQKDATSYQIAQAVRQESNPEAQLRAFKAWGAATGRSQDARERSEFASSAVPKLLEIALANPDPGEQRAALQALASSRTLEAQKALHSIAEKTSSKNLSKLAKGLAENISPQNTSP